MDEANLDLQITIPCCEMASQVTGRMSPTIEKYCEIH